MWRPFQRRKTTRHRTDANSRAAWGEVLEPRRVLDSTVVINEIMFNPPGSTDAQMEFVELHNQLAVDLDISNWRLSGAVEYEFPEDTVVPGRSQLVIASDPNALRETAGLEVVYGPWDGRLRNGGETISLFNNDERLMNQVAYDDEGDWPAGADGAGPSLSKFNQQSASHVAANWTFSKELGGTPGRDNFIQPDTYEVHELLELAAPVTAFVPTDNDLGVSWTQVAFDDSDWLSGETGVGFDTRDDFNEFFGLNLDEPPNGQVPQPMINVSPSVFIRIPFEYDGETKFDRLELRMRFEDGFVSYLNGVEWSSQNTPEHDENGLPWDTTATRTPGDFTARKKTTFDLGPHLGLFQKGTNILAFHGLNRRVTDSDLLFSPEIVGYTKIESDSRSSLLINEVSVPDGGFFVEIINRGDTIESLEGLSLQTPDGVGSEFLFDQATLAPGERVVVDRANWTLAVEQGDHVMLVAADNTVLDIRKLSDRLMGYEEDSGIWQYPNAPSAGGENEFEVDTDVVINEVMYHSPTKPGELETGPEYERTVIFAMENTVWRYNQAGEDLGADWHRTFQAVDNEKWFSGPAPIGAPLEDSGVHARIKTEITPPRDNDPRFVTHYFQTEFELTSEDMALADVFEFSYLLDDGALIYLNGLEFDRINMSVDEVTFETRSAATVRRAGSIGPSVIPKELLREGTNRLSVELHQDAPGSRDMMMAVQLSRGKMVKESVPGRRAEPNDEEWIELFNRGNGAVDLSGWQLSHAVSFEFPNGTVIDPGEYLVVANDRDKLQGRYSDVRVMGDFNGVLSNRDDDIRLMDASRNLVDNVHYYESGRWPNLADGGGVSLELKNPFADNSVGESWSISDNSEQSTWTEHSRIGVAGLDVTGNNVLFHEFIFGMLDEGEIYIDDISVVEDPRGEAIQVMQNGDFEGDEPGAVPAHWRMIGNHYGTVVADPTDPTNQVLHVRATGPHQHVHDHAETTFADGRELTVGNEYQISFRAKWIRGSSQLNNRLFFHRLPDTLNLNVPAEIGTPGRRNDSFEEKAGPSYVEFGHAPTTPSPNQPVVVNVRAEDVDGVDQVTLWWRLDAEQQEWYSLSMSADATGRFRGEIPGHDAGAIVQFYVEGVDTLGVTSMFPAEGPDSRAMFQVADGRNPSTPVDLFRVVILEEDAELLFTNLNRMSNQYRGITLVHGYKSLYDVDMRMIGSRWIRPNSGYKIRLHADQALFGVHDSVRLDLNGLAEIVMKQMINRAGGGKTSAYDDIGYLVMPRISWVPNHTQAVLVNLARFENAYLNEQFENGSQGTKWELDDVVFPTSPQGRNPEGLKMSTEVITNADIGVSSAIAKGQGNDPEFYRAHLLIKSNRTEDRFDAIKAFAQAIHTPGEDLFAAANAVMDVDLWMRHYANQSYFGNWDTYGFRRPKNLRLYQRPEDGKMIPFFWDCDLCNFSEMVYQQNEPTSRLDEIRDIPHNLRLFWGHMLDYINRSFNEEYVTRWAAHYGSLTDFETHGGDETFKGIAKSTANRSRDVLTQIREAIPEVAFAITTPDGIQVPANQQSLRLKGTGWVDVREIRMDGLQSSLDVFWPTTDTWQIDLPFTPNAAQITLQAFDFQGDLINADSVSINRIDNPALVGLRVTEVNFNPAATTDREGEQGYGNDDFEFIEVVNTLSQPLSLSDVRFVRIESNGRQQGVEFDFSNSDVQNLGPGERVVIVEDLEAFRARYGDQIKVAGEWSGGLGNGSEMITLMVGRSILQQFTYNDDWHPDADGNGSSLVIVDAAASLDAWGRADGWAPSGMRGGSPGLNTGRPGDANGDGVFDSEDLMAIFQIGEYEDGIAGNSTFAEGDWDGDGDFTTEDLVLAFRFGGYVYEQPAAQKEGFHGSAGLDDDDDRLTGRKERRRMKLDALKVDCVFGV